MQKLVIVRHGESKWNKENKFTGWTDVDLSFRGIKEAKYVGKTLKEKGFLFDLAYTSVLKRAIYTLWIILKELDQTWLPVEKNWCLNERHYGSLQGLNKFDVENIHGQEQVKIWRRSFSVAPPALSRKDIRYPGNDPRYSHLNINQLPLSESLEATFNRVIPYYKTHIFPYIKNNKKIIIVAHGNSIRALLKYLSNMSDKKIYNINIPTGVPLVYEFDNLFFKSTKYYYIKQ